MLSYAGVALSDPLGSEVEAFINGVIHPEQLFPLAYNCWPGYITSGPIMDVTPEPPRPIYLTRLWWPTGASRFARAHFVVNDDQLTRIRQQVQTDGNRSSQAATLVMADGTGDVSVSLWMMVAGPLQQVGDGANVWLLTLVDARYWWWGTPLSLSVNAGVTMWAQLYAQVGTALGLTITVDTIPSAYGTPTIEYAAQYRPLPAVLDAIAWSVQQRIVVDPATGAVSAVNSSSAYTTMQSFKARAPKPYAGGRLALT